MTKKKKQNNIVLPNFKIETVQFFCGDPDSADTLEVCGVEEGDYVRIKTPAWLKELFKQMREAGKRDRSKQIRDLVNDKEEDWI